MESTVSSFWSSIENKTLLPEIEHGDYSVWKNAKFVPGPKFHSSDLEAGYKNLLQAVSRAYIVDSLMQRNDL